MRIAIVHHQFKLKGGMETYLFNLIKGFSDQQDKVSVYVYKQDSLLEQPICEIKTSFLGWLPRSLRKFWFGANVHKKYKQDVFDLKISLMRSFYQDIVICGGTHRGFLTHAQRKINFLDKLEILFEQKSYETSKRVVAHSDQLKQELIEWYNVPPHKIQVTHPPIDTHKFNQNLRANRELLRLQFNIHPSKKAILFPSTGHKRKGFALLAAAFQDLPADEYELVIAGDKPSLKSCMANYVGFVEDMASLYSACDVTILPSFYEPFGLAIIESLQCGTPVIISKFVGAKDLITENEGIVLADLSPTSIAKAIVTATTQQFCINPNFAEQKRLTIDAHIHNLKKTFSESSTVSIMSSRGLPSSHDSSTSSRDLIAGSRCEAGSRDQVGGRRRGTAGRRDEGRRPEPKSNEKKKKQRVDKLFHGVIDKKFSIAFICSFCLGDTLISLVTANNFLNNGYDIEVFGDYAYALRDWFPQFKVAPLLKLEQQKELQRYDYVLHMYESELSKQVEKWHANSITLSDSIAYLADMTMTDIQVSLCEKEFGLKNLQRINNIKPLSGLNHKANSKRIVYHPTSSLDRKNWPASKFLRLAKQFEQEGFENYFLVSPQEREEWLWIEKTGIQLPSFSSLSKVAEFIYESAYFIGNDSGIGHLASNLGIPTVSIILRKGVAKQWRPTWAPGRVVLSPNWLNPRPIKEKLWKVFTRVETVKHAFDALRREVGETQ